jgi:hypothetical protein
MDPLSPAITFFDSEGKGRTSYIGSLAPEKLFYPTPGLWFTQQGDEVTQSQYSSTLVTYTQTLERLMSFYENNPYPSNEEMIELAARVNAPDVQKVRQQLSSVQSVRWLIKFFLTKIETFFRNMHIRSQLCSQ